MGVQIIEQFICSKYPDQKKCEDGLFISSDFIAVIDGVTSKGALTWPDGSEGGAVFPSPMTSAPANSLAARLVFSTTRT